MAVQVRRQTITKFASVALGLLVFIFGFMLLVMAALLFLRGTPGIGSFAFAVSIRTITGAVVALLIVLAAVLFFIARARRRRR